MIRSLIGACALLLMTELPVSAQTLAPYKDDLFAYPATLSEEKGYKVVDYQELRDVNGRDEVPERRVHKQYVSLGVRSVQKSLKIDTPEGPALFMAVGKQEGASMIVLYLHGQGGNKLQGVNDMTFGGNFNRVKNLVAKAGGIYISPDFLDFGERGAGQVAAIIQHYVEKSPGAPVFVACGSQGGTLCWRLAQNPDVAAKLGGLILLGSMWDAGFLKSQAYKRKVPVFFGHGSRDPVFAVDKQEDFYRKMLGKSGSYPARFVRFESGIHGTPIRMVDWRDTLNWMLARGSGSD